MRAEHVSLGFSPPRGSGGMEKMNLVFFAIQLATTLRISCVPLSPPFSSQKLPRSPGNPSSKHRRRHWHIDKVKRAHGRLDPRLVHVNEEVFDALFHGGRGGIVAASRVAVG